MKEIKSDKKLYLLFTHTPKNKKDIFQEEIEKYKVNFHLTFTEEEAIGKVEDLFGLRSNKRDLIISFILEENIKDCLLALEDKFDNYKEGGYSYAIALKEIIGKKNFLYLANLGNI